MARTTKGRIFQRGKVWYVQYYLTGRQVVQSLRTTDKRVAQRLADERLAGLRIADKKEQAKAAAARLVSLDDELVKWHEDHRPRLLLADVWNRYPYTSSTRGSATRALKPRVAAGNRGTWETFLGWLAESKPAAQTVEDVTQDDAKAYSAYCLDSAKLGARGHNKRIEVCRVMFRSAGVDTNPFTAVRRQAERSEHRDALTMPEIESIIATANGEPRLLVLIGMFTGLRLGDAVTLSWENIRDGKLFKTTAKTGKDISIRLLPVIAEELNKLLHPSSGNGYIMPGLANQYVKDPQAVSKLVRAIFEDCGIQVTEGMEGRKRAVSRRGFHCLRTSFISICARAGVPVGAIAEWCGHSPEVNRIYQRWAGKETDDRIQSAPDGVAKIARTLTPCATVVRTFLTTGDVAALEPSATAREAALANLVRLADAAPLDTIHRAIALLEDTP